LGQAWTQQEDTGPSPRKFHALAFDLVRSRVVLFGGDPGTGKALGDTWSWDGSAWTQTSNFGADPCMRAAMVSTDVQIAMFGGLDSTSAAPTPTVFRETWVFDGKRWTHRQDIGPGPRWAHAMAYDSARRTIVLFGGLPIYGKSDDAALADHLLGDTWEHIETDVPPAPPPGPAPGPNVTALTLSPTSAAPGNQVVAGITLDVPAPAGTQVELAWVLQSVFDAANASGTPISPSDITVLTLANFSQGASSMSIPFSAPASGEPVVVFAEPNNGSAAIATLTII
jgi:hypothetical protein